MTVRDNGGEFEKIPAGLHRAVCANIFDVGRQPGYQGGPASKKVVVLWEIEPRHTWDGEMKGKHFQVTKIYTQSIGEKATLRIDLTSWRGKAFTPDELKGFELENIIGKPCQLNLVENGDRVKVQNVLPNDKDFQYWTPETPKSYVPKFVETMKAGALPTSGGREDDIDHYENEAIF